MNTQSSWSKDELIPEGLTSSDKATKKEALKLSGKERQSPIGFENESIFGDKARKCKIFISEDDIKLFDVQVKSDLSKYNNSYLESEKAALDAKSKKEEEINKNAENEMNLLVNGNESVPSIEKIINDKFQAMKTKLNQIQSEYDSKSIEVVNDYNKLESEIVTKHSNDVKPILDKFGQDGSLYDFTKEYTHIVEAVKENAEPKTEKTEQMSQAEKEANVEEKVVEASNPQTLFDAFQKIRDIENINCEVQDCDQLTKIINTDISEFSKSVVNSIQDGDKKTNAGKVSFKEILGKVDQMKSVIEKQLTDHQIEIEKNTTIFSNRRAKMTDVAVKLKLAIENVTTQTLDKLKGNKKDLSNKLGEHSKNRNNQIKNTIKMMTSDLNNLLKELNNKANTITDNKNMQIKTVENEHKAAVKVALDGKNKSMKNYSFNLEKPINGVAYYKSYSGGVFGSASQHQECQVLGVTSNNDPKGVKLQVKYIRKGSKKVQTTAINNVCLLKQ